MKSLSFIAIMLFGIMFNNNVVAQSQKETVKVWGNCGMCKTRIEKAALSAGASKATWDGETHDLTLKFDVSKTSSMAIQEAIAKVGHDTRDVTADETAYNNLHGCCKYERKSADASAPKKCCKDGNKTCSKESGEKKCNKDEKSCCKEGGDKKCCAEGKACCKEGGDKKCSKAGKSCSKESGDMKCGEGSACCKEGGDKKCCAEGKACCKESGDKKCCGSCKG